jgi:hypothetical protein
MAVAEAGAMTGAPSSAPHAPRRGMGIHGLGCTRHATARAALGGLGAAPPTIMAANGVVATLASRQLA